MMELLTKPAVDVVDLGRLKAHLRIDGDDHDLTLGAALETAIALLDGPEGELGRALVNQTWQQVLALPPFGGPLVELELSPVSSIVSVERRGDDGEWAAIPEADYDLVEVGGRFYVAASAWPRTSPTRVTYVAGYGGAAEDVPAPIRSAITLLAAHFFEMPSPVVYGAAPVEVPISIDRLLSGYKILWR